MSQTIEVKVPDIGDFKGIPIIEVLVKPGDSVQAEDPLITLESDKATMDIPAPVAGVVKELKVKVGDKVSEGNVVMTLETAAVQPVATAQPAAASATPPAIPAPAPRSVTAQTQVSPTASLESIDAAKAAHASPSVRHFARELGV